LYRASIRTGCLESDGSTERGMLACGVEVTIDTASRAKASVKRRVESYPLICSGTEALQVRDHGLWHVCQAVASFQDANDSAIAPRRC
jgi:hypothetical protein